MTAIPIDRRSFLAAATGAAATGWVSPPRARAEAAGARIGLRFD